MKAPEFYRGVLSDEDAAAMGARNKERADRMKVQMGARYVCHQPINAKPGAAPDTAPPVYLFRRTH